MNIVNSPALPFWGYIPDGVHPGKVIQIDGRIPNHCTKFEVNLFCGNEVGHQAEKHSNIALQIRSKIDTNEVICNSRHFGSWGNEEKHRNFNHLHHGSNFNIQIMVEPQHYRVLINGQDISMSHRIPFHEVRVLNIEGDLDVHRIEYRQQYGTQPSAPVYVAPSKSYPSSSYRPPATVYPGSLPIYMAPTMVEPAYFPQPIVVKDRHHNQDHHHHGHHH